MMGEKFEKVVLVLLAAGMFIMIGVLISLAVRFIMADMGLSTDWWYYAEMVAKVTAIVMLLLIIPIVVYVVCQALKEIL